MSYVDDHLLPGERVAYRAHLHKIIYVVPALLAVVFAAGATAAFMAGSKVGGALLLVVGALPLVWKYIQYTTSEFAVTDKRVIIKLGWIRRRTAETMLHNVEAIGADQSVMARLLGFGTITVIGTGGTKETFQNIAEPLEFRRQVQGQISVVQNMRNAVVAPDSAMAAAGKRDERDCPYCAERILARARVCKHCGRDVEPL